MKITRRQLRKVIKESYMKNLYGELQNDILSIGQEQGGELVVDDVINYRWNNENPAASMSYDEVLEIMQNHENTTKTNY